MTLSFVCLAFRSKPLGITPCYNSFNNNFSLRNGGTLIRADTTENNYVITEAILEAAYKEAEDSGKKVKMLVFTNPNNPTGTVYTEEEMRMILGFCRKHNIHLVCFVLHMLHIAVGRDLRSLCEARLRAGNRRLKEVMRRRRARTVSCRSPRSSRTTPRRTM